MSEPNLQVLRGRSLKPQREGDIFAMLLPDGEYLFGRVIRANLQDEAPMPTANLVYIYRVRSTRKEPPVAELRPDALLLPPVFINRMPWTRGYFETVANEPLGPGDLLPVHSFRSFRPLSPFVDLDGHPQETPIEPVGDWGLMSYRMLDDLISRALGIPEAPP